MLKRLMPLIVFLGCLLPAIAFCGQAPQVIILPFEILSQSRQSYLQDEIPKAIAARLRQDGAVILDAAKSPQKEWKAGDLSVQAARHMGVRSGADYVIWGSLTWIGHAFSLDAKMIESFGEDRPHFFFREGQGVENLLATVKALSEDIGLKIFRREKVAKVLVEGTQRIEVDAIKKNIKIKPGDVYLAKSLSEDLKSVYAMGYFDDIRIEGEDGPDGKIITFKVKEKPTIRIIRVSRNKVYEDDKIIEALSIRTGSILNIFQVRNNLERIKELYREKNYHNVKVEYKIHEIQHNQADLEYVIEEGVKLRVEKIIFIGNSAYPDKELKGLMKTSEKGFFFWLSDSGNLNTEDLNQDAAKLAAFYNNHGFIDAKVGEPQIDYKETWIEITIKIDEGRPYKVGQVKVAGDLLFPEAELIQKLRIKKDAFYNRENLRADILALTDLYSDEGYAYAAISPLTKKNEKALTVDITYQIDKRKKVYFERILISGNTKTRDKVIRRELDVYEQALYKGAALKRGVRRLYKLDYFEDVKVDTVKGSADDQTILKINVAEKPTGAFSFGGGYSTVESLFFLASVTQRNLFGKGQILQLQAELGGRSSRYTLSFTEPWLFDIPLSAGIDLFNWDYDYDTYDKASLGARLRFSYPLFEFTRLHLIYTYDRADVRDISVYASDDIKDLEGINITSSIYTGLRYDSTDRMFNPTEGSKHSAGVEYAGLGGNIGFTKLTAETGWYIPLIWKTVGSLHGKTGYVFESSGKKLPDYERFYLGGMNSMRGFDFQDICVLDEKGAEIGGDKFVQFNAEYIVPLIKEAGLVAVLFYDTGNVYGKNDNIDLGGLRQSIGYGFRWYSPMGPMRLENGYILDPEPGESTAGRWEFSMGGAF